MRDGRPGRIHCIPVVSPDWCGKAAGRNRRSPQYEIDGPKPIMKRDRGTPTIGSAPMGRCACSERCSSEHSRVSGGPGAPRVESNGRRTELSTGTWSFHNRISRREAALFSGFPVCGEAVQPVAPVPCGRPPRSHDRPPLRSEVVWRIASFRLSRPRHVPKSRASNRL